MSKAESGENLKKTIIETWYKRKLSPIPHFESRFGVTKTVSVKKDQPATLYKTDGKIFVELNKMSNQKDLTPAKEAKNFYGQI